jgi:hypothetical protein
LRGDLRIAVAAPAGPIIAVDVLFIIVPVLRRHERSALRVNSD